MTGPLWCVDRGPGDALEGFPEGNALQNGCLVRFLLAVETALAVGGEDWQSEQGAGGAGQKAFASGEKWDTSLPVLLPHHSGGHDHLGRQSDSLHRRCPPVLSQPFNRLSMVAMWPTEHTRVPA